MRSSEPNNVIILANRGRAYNKAERFDLALQDLDKAISLDATHYRSWQRRAVSHLGIGEPDQALADVERALEIRPTALSYYTRSRVFQSLGDSEHAKSDLERAQQRDPRVEDDY